jgi:hypothetical protein
MKLSKLGVAFVLLSIGVGASAAAQERTAWSNEFVPTAVFAGYTAGEVYVSGMSLPTNWDGPNEGNRLPEACRTGTLKIKTDPGQVMSIALAAMLSGNKFTCIVNQACEGSYPTARQCKIVR